MLNNLNVLGNLSENENIINLIDKCLRFDCINLCPFFSIFDES